MSRNDLTRHWRNRPWRVRAVVLALAATGLATAAFAAADFTGWPDANKLGRTITRQRVAAGEPAKTARARQDTPLTPDQMFAAAASWENEMSKTLEHAETMRLQAYRSRDIIRMTCVDERLGQMKEVWAIVKPRFTTIHAATGDELSLRSQFTTIREGAERIAQLADDLEQCVGDTLDSVSATRLPGEDNGPGAAIDDPTLPPNPTTTPLDRPGYASPMR
jgi:hypothetical protein